MFEELFANRKGVMHLIDNAMENTLKVHITTRVLTEEYTVSVERLSEGKFKLLEIQQAAFAEAISVLRGLGLGNTVRAVLALMKPTVEYLNSIAQVANDIVIADKAVDKDVISKACNRLMQTLLVKGDEDSDN